MGTRMHAAGTPVPKPLVEIGGRPILWHVMSLYAQQGFTSFILLLGHGGDQIEEFASELDPRWEVTCLNTGLGTPTGGRLHQARHVLGGGTFMLTYADGLADIDLDGLLTAHRMREATATITVVRPQNPWGVARIDAGGRIRGFVEKPRLECWVNGGFMVMEPSALDSMGAGDV